VIYSQHDKTLAIEAILKHVGRAEHLQYDLAAFFPAGDRSPKLGMLAQHLHLRKDFLGNSGGKRRMLLT
jgi:hypothetical protein